MRIIFSDNSEMGWYRYQEFTKNLKLAESEMIHRKMKASLFSVVVAFLLNSVSAFALPADTAVYLPEGYRSDSQWPLVVLLHGSGATGDMQDLHLGISARVSKKGMILAVPEARPTAGSGITSNQQMLTLLEQLKTAYSVDPSRIYLIGHSMGGYQSLSFACDHGDKIAGMVISAAVGVCRNSTHPVNMLLATGTSDLSETNVEATLASWRRVNGCNGSPEITDGLDLHWEISGGETKKSLWTGCTDGSKIASLRSSNGRHVPIFKGSFADQALDFLLGTTSESVEFLETTACTAENDDAGNYTTSTTQSDASSTVLTINQYSDSACRNLLASVAFSGPGNQGQQSVSSLKFESVTLTPVAATIVTELNGQAPTVRPLCGQTWQTNVAANLSGRSGATRQSCVGSVGSISGPAAFVKKLVLSYMFSPPLPGARY
jgi:polyhydroxybutyrate depolymerase